MPEILLDSISFSFGSRLILDRVSLHVSNDERAFLIGPNGVGKSTLLRVLTGELTPDSGQNCFWACSSARSRSRVFRRQRCAIP